MSFGEPVPDATGELRLQLMQAQDQREAFRALGHRDVLAVIREALATDLSETCDKLRAEITRMEGENHRLRAEVERLTKLCQATSPDGFVHVRDIKHHPIMGPAWEERQKVANLIPPIVESNAIPEGKAVLVNIYQHQQDADEIKRLKAEVERLRKAGDAMAAKRVAVLAFDPLVKAWNAAKEGKQS